MQKNIAITIPAGLSIRQISSLLKNPDAIGTNATHGRIAIFRGFSREKGKVLRIYFAKPTLKNSRKEFFRKLLGEPEIDQYAGMIIKIEPFYAYLLGSREIPRSIPIVIGEMQQLKTTEDIVICKYRLPTGPSMQH